MDLVAGKFLKQFPTAERMVLENLSAWHLAICGKAFGDPKSPETTPTPDFHGNPGVALKSLTPPFC